MNTAIESPDISHKPKKTTVKMPAQWIPSAETQPTMYTAHWILLVSHPKYFQCIYTDLFGFACPKG